MRRGIHWLVMVAYLYCILILLVNVSVSVYTNYQANQIKKTYSDQQKKEAERLEQNNNNQYPIFDGANPFQPIIESGEAAKTATPILILNIWVSSITTICLLLPKFYINKIEALAYKYDANINVDVYEKFILIIFICNMLLMFFDFLTVKSYLDFANTIIK